ncbi:MAG TPA: peptidoglycan-associated lipoprotein Pal [Thermoanaerobaculia bacterium]
MSKLIAVSVVLLAVAFAPACRSKKKDIPPPRTTPETAAPIVEPPPAQTSTDTSVKAPDDFVRETPAPTEETMPADIESLNRYVQERGYLRDAFFNYDEATIDGDAQAALDASATWLKSRDGAGYNLLIEGHCDERGTEQYNLALGDRRANAAREYLATLGVESGRIRTVSYGEERPFDEGHDDSAWAKNRRAHLVLVR